MPALYVLSTLFFVYQHTTGISWDFAVYVLNAKYMFGGGFYFEWERAPLMPFILFLLSFGGYLLAEYLYIIFVSGLFCLACVSLAAKSGLDRDLFYALMLNPFVLNYGLMAGTELLTLSLLMLSMAFIGGRRSSVFLGLGVLARYTSLAYLPLMLFKRSLREVLLGLALIAVLFAPWLWYNQAVKGHPLYSFVSSYFLNITAKDSVFVEPVLARANTLLWVCVILLLLTLWLRCRRGFGEFGYMMLAFTVLSSFTYWGVTVKEIRYLFNLILPAGYFTAYVLGKFTVKRDYARKALCALIVLMSFTATPFFIALYLPPGFYDGVEAVRGDCMVTSNLWPHLNYLGVQTQPNPWQDEIRGSIGEGRRVLLYMSPKVAEPDYRFNRTFIETLPVIEENQNYILLGDGGKCAPKERVDKPYMEHYGRGGGNASLCLLEGFCIYGG